MSKKNNGASNALVQGSILAVASIISRIIGLIYRIPMQRILGDIGIGYYSTAFEIYNVMLIISSYSLPLAVSKMVSAQMAKKRRTATYQILKCALLFATISGTTVALILFFGGNFFATTLLNTPYSIFALRVLAPGLLVVAVLGVIRGFFQGLGTMMPSAVSQIIEQIVNAIVSVWAAYVLYRTGTRIGAVLGDKEHYAAAYGAAGGTLGTVLGSVAALLFVVFIFAIYMKVFKRQMKRERNVRVSSFGYTMKILVITVIPVLLSTTIYNISGIIDQGIFKQVALLQGYTQNDIDVWWGYSLSTLSNGLLQGIDRLKVPVINAAISIVAHVIVLILLMLIFRLNIHAVVLANTFFALLMCFMNSMALKKYSGFKQEIKKTFIIPAISSLIMGVISYIVYFILYKACHIEIIAFILAAIIAVISYAVALLQPIHFYSLYCFYAHIQAHFILYMQLCNHCGYLNAHFCIAHVILYAKTAWLIISKEQRL